MLCVGLKRKMASEHSTRGDKRRHVQMCPGCGLVPVYSRDVCRRCEYRAREFLTEILFLLIKKHGGKIT